MVQSNVVNSLIKNILGSETIVRPQLSAQLLIRICCFLINVYVGWYLTHTAEITNTYKLKWTYLRGFFQCKRIFFGSFSTLGLICEHTSWCCFVHLLSEKQFHSFYKVVFSFLPTNVFRFSLGQ